MKLLQLVGSIHGREKNCGVIAEAIEQLSPFEKTETIYLKERMPLERVVVEADAYLFVTACYWDSCASDMQAWFEDFTHLECDSRIMGKPAGVIVMCHSVGGKSVLSRLQGVLSCEGFMIPPLTGLVLSRDALDSNSKDAWTPAEIDVVLKNLHTASTIKLPWSRWAVDRDDVEKVWVDIDK